MAYFCASSSSSSVVVVPMLRFLVVFFYHWTETKISLSPWMCDVTIIMFEEGRGLGFAVDLHTHDVWMKGAELAWRACDVTLGSSARSRAAPTHRPAASLVPAGFFRRKVIVSYGSNSLSDFFFLFQSIWENKRRQVAYRVCLCSPSSPLMGFSFFLSFFLFFYLFVLIFSTPVG